MSETISKPTDRYESVPCDLCGTDAHRLVFPGQNGRGAVPETFRSSGDEKLSDPLVACENCGLLYVNPRLRSDLILQGYREAVDERFVGQAAARERTFRRVLRWIETRQSIPHRGRLLDIGTAGGSFLAVARGEGWDVEGCEINPWLCDWGCERYGLSIRPGEVTQQDYPEASFDLITLWDVLEHVPSPRQLVQESRRLLKKGGLFVVNYPDIGSWISRAMGRQWVFLLSVHLYYFTRRTMAELLEACGFSVILFRPHFQFLEAGYLFERMQTTAPTLGRIGQAIANRLHVSRLSIPYWMGQTLVLAQK